MYKKFSMALVLLISSACAVDGADFSGEEYQDTEPVDGVLAALSCPSFTASNSAHVQAGRAYTRYSFLRRVTTYYARGTNQTLGTSATASTTLYETSASVFSTSSGGCEASDAATPRDASVPPTDASVSPADASSADASAVPDAGNAASPGCGLAPPTSGSGKTLTISGVARTYVLSVPANYDRARAYPLVFGFHGLGGSGAQAQLYFGLGQATQGQAILVYPDATGSNKAWGISGTAASADLAFFDELVRTMSNSLCIDESRIFAAGHSMGGYFSNALGCARADTLRAIAPVAGGGPYLSCSTGKVGAWIFAARDDAVVSYTAGEASRNHWTRANACASATRAVGPGACVAYDNCDPSHPVHWCLESTGGHGWPSYGGQAIWSFFRSL